MQFNVCKFNNRIVFSFYYTYETNALYILAYLYSIKQRNKVTGLGHKLWTRNGAVQSPWGTFKIMLFVRATRGHGGRYRVKCSNIDRKWCIVVGCWLVVGWLLVGCWWYLWPWTMVRSLGSDQCWCLTWPVTYMCVWLVTCVCVRVCVRVCVNGKCQETYLHGSMNSAARCTYMYVHVRVMGGVSLVIADTQPSISRALILIGNEKVLKKMWDSFYKNNNK